MYREESIYMSDIYSRLNQSHWAESFLKS